MYYNIGLGILTLLCNYFSDNPISCDAPRAWGLYFQDNTSSQMEALVELHDNMMYYLVSMLFSDYLIILKDKCSPGLEWALHNLPKPYTFTSLPLHSSTTASGSGDGGNDPGDGGEDHPNDASESVINDLTNKLESITDYLWYILLVGTE